MCNPNNPTSSIINLCDIHKILKKLKKQNGFLIIDEIYMDFVENNNQYKSSHLINHFDNLIIMKSFSKFFSVPGLRLAYSICNNYKLTTKLKKLNPI